MSICNRLVPGISVLAFALLGSSSHVTYAATQNRINAVAETGSRASVEETVPLRARRSKDMGAVAGDRMLSSIGLHFNLTAAQQADLNQLLAAQQDPTSPQYHQWLTPQQYGARFGLSSSDLAKVKTWLQGQGLTVTSVAPSMNYVTVSGTVAQIDRAFNTSIHSVSEDGVTHISNLIDPSLPAAIAGVVSSITGLNDFKPASRSRVSEVKAESIATPRFTSSISGSHYIAPGDFFAIYDVNPLLQNGTNGSGITIAVMGQTNISTTDVDAFRSASGLPARTASNFIITLIPGPNPGTVSADIDEAQLDVEWSNAVAPNSTINYVNSGTSNGVMDSLIYSITNKVAPILSISYGACEVAWGQSTLNSYNQYFQQANAQGMTIVGPSGDSGATDCDYQVATASLGLAVDFPASSPYVTGAGGTMFNEGSGSYWNATNGNYSGSATGYIPETVWNESNSTGLGAGGGGVSSYFGKPAWQTGSGVPADLSRDVPDISLNSASTHDGYLFCSRGSCTNGYRNASSNLNVVGGTSVAAPSFAGILALLEQGLGAKTGLGNVNPMIYGLANSTYYGNVFHDVAAGNNNSPCIAGSKDCPSGGTIGYTATVGYDRATGWGSLDVYNFVTKWALVTPAGSGGAIGTALSTTSLSLSAGSCGVATGAVTLAIKVTGSGSVPTGTVQILVDNVALTDPASLVTLDGTGSATYKLTSSLSGTHTISAVYSGNAAFASSKASSVSDFVSSSAKDFSLTPCTGAITVTSGSTGTPISFTLTPYNGFTGSIALTATPDEALAAQYTFSPVSPVSITSTSPTSITLTIAAFQKNAQLHKPQFGPAIKSAPHHLPWYEAGSGAALACTLLITVPRRRRWGALLTAVLAIGAFSATGCGGGATNSNSSGSTTTTTNATAGTYSITVTGVSGTSVHTSTITLKVQ